MDDKTAQPEVTPVDANVPQDTDLIQPKEKSHKTKYIVGALGVLVLLIGALVARYFLVNTVQNVTPNEPKYTGAIENVRIGNVGVYTIFNLIAKEQGFFNSNGLNAEITEYSSGPESLASLLAGKTDVNIAADFVGVRNIFANNDIRILAQVNQHRIFQLATKKDKISSPKDLKGKKIGVTKNSAGEYFLGNFLAANSMTLEDVVRVDLTPLDMITQVEDGTIDAMIVFEPHVYNLKKKLGQNFASWDIQGDQNISAVLYTSKAFIEKNPEVVKRYLQALVDAEEYYQTHLEETKELVANQFKFEDEYIEYSWPKLTHRITLNQELLLGMEDEARWTIKNKLTDKTAVPNYLDFVYFDALKSVKPEAVTIIQ